MICCDFCPNVMHAACCGIDDPSSLGSMWSCPHHKCVTCGRKAYAAGGLLFRCSECPKAYCEDHLPPQSELIGGEVDRLLALGFQVWRGAWAVGRGPWAVGRGAWGVGRGAWGVGSGG